MLTYLSGFIRSFIYYLIVARQLKRQRKFMALELKPLLDNAQSHNDGSMDTDDFKKINLYGLAIPAVLGEAFCSLRGKPMTEKERMSVTCLGGITGLFDDLFDRKNLSPDYIYQLLQHPTEKNSANINEKLLVKLYTLGLKNSDKPELIKTYAAKVYEAQLMSLRQNAPGYQGSRYLLVGYGSRVHRGNRYPPSGLGTGFRAGATSRPETDDIASPHSGCGKAFMI